VLDSEIKFKHKRGIEWLVETIWKSQKFKKISTRNSGVGDSLGKEKRFYKYLPQHVA